ncbi:hypothetical protein [Marinospirillum insulare]|uniref:Uncharacterized protein n=1 Tax=Marinospirillum insulare TaxID=217169 RepID=A0ABQ6A4S5_9GAMM|nr:hypothetical protein [Marinospirillum insulare]GLR65090.1 hypothetical protein GCM10007878_25290 [Marinospirillum insulare]
MVGISSKLLRSIITITILHLAIGAFLYLSMNPSQYENWLGFLNHAVPVDLTLLTLNSYLMDDIKNSIVSWGSVFAASSAVGLMLPIAFVVIKKVVFRGNSKQKPAYRGLTVTIGEVYAPQELKLASNRYVWPSEIDKAHQPLLKGILNYHATNKRQQSASDTDTCDSFYQYTLDLIDLAITKYADSQLVLVVAAHGLGRLSKDAVPYASAKTIRQLDAWWKLEANQRDVIALAVEYQDSVESIPISLPYLAATDRSVVLELIKKLKDVLQSYQAEEAVESVIVTNSQEPKPVIEEAPKPEENPKTDLTAGGSSGTLLLKALKTAIAETSFQNYGLQEGVKSLGWRKGNRLYLMERRLAERITEILTEDQLNALGVCQGVIKTSDAMSPITKALCELNEFKDWLVLDAETLTGQNKVKASQPLWVIRAGDKVFAGVLIMELPEVERSIYPKETRYEIAVQSVYRSDKKRKPSFHKESYKKVELTEFPKNILVGQGVTFNEMMGNTMETVVETNKESFQADQNDSFPMESLDELSG